MARRTHDPAERRESALKFLAERYYQTANEFSDSLTASFPPDSGIAAALLGHRNAGSTSSSSASDSTCTARCDDSPPTTPARSHVLAQPAVQPAVGRRLHGPRLRARLAEERGGSARRLSVRSSMSMRTRQTTSPLERMTGRNRSGSRLRMRAPAIDDRTRACHLDQAPLGGLHRERPRRRRRHRRAGRSNRGARGVGRGTRDACRRGGVRRIGHWCCCPVSINGHHHFYQTLTRAYPARAEPIRCSAGSKALYPVWANLTEEAVAVSTRLALAELMLSGCTTASDHHYLFSAGSGPGHRRPGRSGSGAWACGWC